MTGMTAWSWVIICVAACTAALPMAVSAVQAAEDRLIGAQRLLDRGFFEQSLAELEGILRQDRKAGREGDLPDILLLMARGHRMAGQHRKALDRLREAAALLPADDYRKAAAVSLMMADSLVFLDQPDEAEGMLVRAEALSRGDGGRGTPALMNTRGNLLMLKKKYGEAAVAYGRCLTAAEAAGDISTAAKAAVNGAKASRAASDFAAAAEFLAAASRLNGGLDDTYDKGYNCVEIALLHHRLSSVSPARSDAGAYAALREALRVAASIGNRRLSSHALGRLGSLDEESGRYEEALGATRRAVFDAQTVNASEILYLWQWQTGRIFDKMGRPTEALEAYRGAVRSLQAARTDSAPECKTFNQVPYDSVIEPLYTGFMDHLIRRSSSLGGKEGAVLLTEAIEALESMKVAEMQDYLQDNCLAPRQHWRDMLGRIGPQTAVVYPIPLDDRIEVIVYIRGELRRFSSPVGRRLLSDETHMFRRKLEDRMRREYLIHARILHDWLVRPMEAELLSHGIDTIVFIPNGPLRAIPLAALHNGENFLISRYAVASAQGFTLIDPGKAKSARQTVFSAGIAAAIEGFPPLESVASELQAISNIYGGLSLLNGDVLLSRIERELKDNSYSIVHFATHGEIGDTSKKTFLLSWDGKITMDDLEKFMAPNRYRRTPVEMLVLSACQSAAGNDRSSLGLAGIALKAGARSSVGTLWSVDDRAAAELIAEFYRNLGTAALSRAKALQKAQLLLIEHGSQHPFYWAPFIVIGNWL